MTVGDLIALSLKEIGVLQVGETPTTSMYFDSLLKLNLMLDEWRTEHLYAYREQRDEVNLVAAQQAYALNPRPVRIDRAGYLESGTETPVYVARSVTEWSQVSLKSYSTRYPCAIYYDEKVPNGELLVYPVPSVGAPDMKLAIYTWQILSGYPDAPDQVESTIASTVTLPPGYGSAIELSLAERMAPSFGVEASPLLMMQAAEARGKIKALNIRPLYQASPLCGLLGGGSYDIMSDTYGIR